MALLKRWFAVPFVLALFLSPLVAAESTSAPLSDAQVRAAMVYNFASFTEWPDSGSPERPVVIGVIGNEALAKALQASGKLGNGREIDVRALSDGEGLTQCQVLYVSAASDRAVSATLARVGTMPVLTVGEQEHFTQLGGIIRVYPESNRLRFEVDMAHATSVRLKISSRVLNLARLVRDSDAPNP
jgi:hypothetical protein